VTASDRESNAGASAKEAELVSSPVLIDNTPPVVRVLSSRRTGATADVAFEAKDAASALRRAEWSLNAGNWSPAAPTDGILDSPGETFALHLTDLAAGEHVLAFRVSDSGGNTAVAKVILP
jgi:Tfp pilus assembly protein PilX